MHNENSNLSDEFKVVRNIHINTSYIYYSTSQIHILSVVYFTSEGVLFSIFIPSTALNFITNCKEAVTFHKTSDNICVFTYKELIQRL